MTRINKLVLNGFKSFAKFTELQFGEKYNCVLGPNGSGKSNILDALCFVLGKSGSKSLRAEKSANLIYNGGKSKKPSKKGEVSIYFDNKDKTFPTEETEIKVTRIIKDNGQSIYRINDQTRTRQQILDLLNIAKIEPDGYNIILQGDIVRFCEMGTAERRILIEEISGISVYEEKKNKAMNQLNKVDERLKEAEIILSERKTYLRELKKDRDQALKFKEMNDNIRKYKATLLKHQIDAKDLDSKDLKEKIEKNNTSLEESTAKITQVKEEIGKRKEEIEAITSEIEQKGETDQVNLNREIEDLKIEMTKKNSRTETLKTELNKLEQRKQDLKKGLDDTNEKVSSLNKEKEEYLESKKEKQGQKEEFDGKVKAFKEKNNIEAAGEIEKKIDELDKLADELSKEINFIRETQHNLLREKDKVDHELATLDASIAKVKEIEKEHKQQLDELKAKRDEFKETTLELNKILDEDSNIAAKIATTRETVHKYNEELAKLSARNASIKEFSLGDRAIKSILEKKNSTPGIYGTVSELGTVDSKYGLALEVAAGPRIKSIVVENDNIAAEQIKYLRNNKLGIATFIPLNKIKARNLDEKVKKLINAKGSHGKADELISYDPKFKKVFSHIFGNTLVVDNIDTARRLGIGAAKMVTLEGDSVETSGAMKGGFRDKKRKGLGFNEAQIDKEIEEYTKKLHSGEAKLSSFESRRNEIEEQITQLRAKKAELEGEIIKSEKSLHLDSGDIALSKKKQDDLQEKAKSIEEDINNIQNKISEKNKELARIKIERQQERSKISDLHNPALVAELSTYEEELKQLNEELIKSESEVKNIDIQINDIFLPEIEKTNSILKEITNDEEVFKKEIDELTKKLESQNTNLKKKEEEAREFYTKFKELFNKRSIINDEISKKDNEISNINNKSREIEIKNNTLSIKNAEISAILSGLNEEFSRYEGVQLDTEKNEEQLKYQIQRFEKIKNEIGSVNMRALEIYEEIEKEYNKLIDKKDTLVKEKGDVESLMTEIESRKKELFMKTYDSVNDEFQKIFSNLSKKAKLL